MKFKYKDKVKIVEGFYQGQVGTVVSYKSSWAHHGFFNKQEDKAYYVVWLDGDIYGKDFFEEQMEVI
jgi:hypothetical protein